MIDLTKLPRSVELVREEGGLSFRYIDERLLPGDLAMAQTSDWREVVDAIRCLAVRGAPAIGLAGAAALALWADEDGDCRSLASTAEAIASARPTAVNLRWAVDRLLAALDEEGLLLEGSWNSQQASHLLFALVKAMESEDEAACRAIGENGAGLMPSGARILTHCNAGSLATSFFGTALGVVYAAAEQGKVERVFADETRPVGQGARLTVWELSRVGVPVTLICDNMAASLMASGGVDAVVVGADRIAANGDTANKIGTYGVAVLAHAHGVPFYVAAPSSTVDATLPDGGGIPIEQRDPSEVLSAPIEGVDVWNPAFDVTPARLITAIITERGVFAPSEVAACVYNRHSCSREIT